MPHRNILLPDSRWVTVFSVFSARACSRKILRVAAIHKYLSWVESLKSPSVRREHTGVCSMLRRVSRMSKSTGSFG